MSDARPRPCPTPRKAYRIADPDTARRAAEAFGVLLGKIMEAYECPCGLYHLRDKAKYNQRHNRQRARRRKGEQQP